MLAAVALGSNTGDRLRNLKQARDMLLPFHRGSRETFLQSPVYETAPVDCPEGSPDFYNAVVVFEWARSGRSLWELTCTIENFLGRGKRVVRNAPRPIDLDVLFVGEEISDDSLLTLPHPRLTERLFVLGPLADIVPDAVIPGTGRTVSSLLAVLPPGQTAVSLVTDIW